MHERIHAPGVVFLRLAALQMGVRIGLFLGAPRMISAARSRMYRARVLPSPLAKMSEKRDAVGSPHAP